MAQIIKEKQCVTCGRLHSSHNKYLCSGCKSRVFREQHPNYNKEWAQNHIDNIKQAQHKYAFTHRQERNKNTREWEKRNPEKALIRKISGVKKDKNNLRHDVLSYYSNGRMSCECCGEQIERFLTIDDADDFHHSYKQKIGTGIRFYRWLRKNNYPYGYRVLCFNCNSGRDLNNGICPHKDPQWNKSICSQAKKMLINQ